MSKVINVAKKPVNKKQAMADILALAESLERDANCAPDKATQNYYQRMARDIRFAHQVHFNTTK